MWSVEQVLYFRWPGDMRVAALINVLLLESCSPHSACLANGLLQYVFTAHCQVHADFYFQVHIMVRWQVVHDMRYLLPPHYIAASNLTKNIVNSSGAA